MNFYSIDAIGPGNIFRECYGSGIINKVETTELLNMIRDRNQTSHAYLEEFAVKVSKNITKHQKLMKDIADRLKSRI